MNDEHLSGLTARFQLGRIDNVEATVTLSASVAFWREAIQSLEKGTDGFGAWQIKAAIRSVVRQAEDSFYERVSSDEKKVHGSSFKSSADN